MKARVAGTTLLFCATAFFGLLGASALFVLASSSMAFSPYASQKDLANFAADF